MKSIAKAAILHRGKGFGLLLISHNIGDPSETLPKPLWIQRDTLISKDPSGAGYKVWEFNCVHRGGRRQDGHYMTSNTSGIVWTIVNTESIDLQKLLGRWNTSYMRAVQTHLHGGGLKDVASGYWNQSKTGEVNSTNFKQNEKAIVAGFLAKTEIPRLLSKIWEVVIFWKFRAYLNPSLKVGFSPSFGVISNSGNIEILLQLGTAEL